MESENVTTSYKLVRADRTLVSTYLYIAHMFTAWSSTYQYSSPPVMHFSYTGPSSSRWLGKMTSLWMMMVLMTSLTCAWHATGSCPSGMGIRVGPKQIAKLYESIMFSSLYWERLRNKKGEPFFSFVYKYYWCKQHLTTSDNIHIVFKYYVVVLCCKLKDLSVKLGMIRLQTGFVSLCLWYPFVYIQIIDYVIND